MQKNKLYIFILFLIFGCKSNLSVIETHNIKESQTPVSQGIVYCLPKTEVIINVNVIKIIEKKGPFSDYTEKYLGSFPQKINSDRIKWKISNIDFKTKAIADTNNIYEVYNTKNISYLPFTLSKEGFLVSYNLKGKNISLQQKQTQKQSWNNETNNNFSFELVPSDKNYKIVYDTVYKEKKEDTVVKKIPVLKRTLVRKTKEEQAKSLADKLITLREDRAALLVGEGDNDYLPTGKALKLMLDEIDKLEASYLSMFIGKTDTVKYTFSYKYIPNKTDIDKTITLFKFSENSGILPYDNIYGAPVSMEIMSDNYTRTIKKFYSSRKRKEKKEQKKEPAGLYCRIPQKVEIVVKSNNKILTRQDIYISQLGTISELPEDLFGNERLKIEFYPELGSIKSIFY